MNADSKACCDSIRGNPDHLAHVKFEAYVDRRDAKKPKLCGRFIRADGSPTNKIYMGAEENTGMAPKLSYFDDNGNYHNEELNIQGDSGRYGNPPIENSRIKAYYQEKEGGSLDKLRQKIIESVKNLITRPENTDLVKQVLLPLSKQMEKEDYTQEKGLKWLKSFEEMNGDFTTSIGERTYKETTSVYANLTTNLFTNSYDPEKSFKSYPPTLFGASLEALGIDHAFRHKKDFRPRKIYDLHKNLVSSEAVANIKKNVYELPIGVCVSLRSNIDIENTNIGIKFYLDTAMVPFTNEQLTDPSLGTQLRSGTSQESASGDAFDFVKCKAGSPPASQAEDLKRKAESPEASDVDTPTKRPKESESETEEEEGVGEF